MIKTWQECAEIHEHLMGPIGLPAKLSLMQREIDQLREALAKQEQGIDWKDMYEKDIGPLEYAVPAKQEQGEPVAKVTDFDLMGTPIEHWYRKDIPIGAFLYTTPPQRKPLTEWISVDEMLPEPYTEVLVTMRYRDEDLQVKTSEHDPDFEENNGWCFGSCFEASVTHWMPMPEAANSIKE